MIISSAQWPHKTIIHLAILNGVPTAVCGRPYNNIGKSKFTGGISTCALVDNENDEDLFFVDCKDCLEVMRQLTWKEIYKIYGPGNVKNGRSSSIHKLAFAKTKDNPTRDWLPYVPKRGSAQFRSTPPLKGLE